MKFFPKNRSRANGLSDWCKDCNNTYHRQWYQIKGKAYSKQRYQQSKRLIGEIKLASGCVDCGYNAYPDALDFDHVRGRKRFKISYGHLHKWSDVLKEIAKCEIVCANCHRIRTAKRRQTP